MNKEIPGPEKLDEIQKDYLSDEQIEKDKIREEAHEAGLARGISHGEEIRKSRHYEKIVNAIKEQNIKKGDYIQIPHASSGDGYFAIFDRLEGDKIYYRKRGTFGEYPETLESSTIESYPGINIPYDIKKIDNPDK